MSQLDHLLENNRRWAQSMREREPAFFSKLALQQTPRYLWLGCADSRVPATTIVGLMPGDMFVHRNVANQIIAGDANSLAVLQYAVEALKVQDIIVCGHYGCGGVAAALRGDVLYGPLDRWLSHLREIRHKFQQELANLAHEEQRWRRLCELNVIEQVEHVATTTIVQQAWASGANLTIHGWIYDLSDGLLRDLGVSRQR